MAEMDTSGGGGHKKGPGVKKAKKASTRVDLTPMVDLGFLLITFFIFTTTMSEARSMKLALPADSKDSSSVKNSGVITLVPAANSSLFYYEGKLATGGTNLRKTSYVGLRELLIQKKQSVDEKDMFVIIKPSSESVYKNTVDVLDEMTINDIKSYALENITAEE